MGRRVCVRKIWTFKNSETFPKLLVNVCKIPWNTMPPTFSWIFPKFSVIFREFHLLPLAYRRLLCCFAQKSNFFIYFSRYLLAAQFWRNLSWVKRVVTGSFLPHMNTIHKVNVQNVKAWHFRATETWQRPPFCFRSLPRRYSYLVTSK